MSDENEVNGSWDDIDKICSMLYPMQEPKHWGTIQRWSLGGDDPLDGISAYDAGDHWHFISYGMTELYEKESDIPEQSGWGFEFSFKIKKDDSEEPPMWVIELLQAFGRNVYEFSAALTDGHFISVGGPINDDLNEDLTAILLSRNPEVGIVDLKTGQFQLLDMLCITDDDIEYCYSDDDASEKLIEEIRKQNSNFINDFRISKSYSETLT